MAADTDMERITTIPMAPITAAGATAITSDPIATAAIVAVMGAAEVPTPTGRHRARAACRQFPQARVAEAVDTAVVADAAADITDNPVQRVA